MSHLSDRDLDHLRDVADLPDLTGTKYGMIERIASGGMGTVYLVEDRDLGRRVALKVLAFPDADGRASAGMRDEARIVARLEHPSIVPVHDAGVLPDGRRFYVMKYVQGESLDRAAQGLPMAALLRIFQRICEAVAFAHGNGVVHCDLKPENIMVGPFGEAIVMDWGIARAAGMERDSGEIAPDANVGAPRGMISTVMGTPAFMAPEMLDGRIDPRVDVYALGAILYFLLTGTRPNPARSIGEYRAWLRDNAPVPPRRLRPDLPRQLEAICLRAIAPDPVFRYQGVPPLADDIARHLDGLPVSAYRESLAERGLRGMRRYRFIILLLLAYLLMRLAVLLLR